MGAIGTIAYGPVADFELPAAMRIARIRDARGLSERTGPDCEHNNREKNKAAGHFAS
jgi:hypothetical protein